MYTRQVENLKRRLRQKRVSRWTENLKGRSRQKLGIEAYNYVSLDHLATRLRYQLSSSDGTNQSDSSSTKKQSDEMLEDIKTVEELEPSGIIHIAVLCTFYKLYKSYLFGGVLLLGRQPLVQKRLFTGKLQNQYKFIFRQTENCFSFICFVLQRTSNVHF